VSTADIERSVRIARPLEESFRLFTDGIDRWWPLKSYSYGGDRSASIHLEAWEGGRFYERLVDGDELQVGTVLRCDPPTAIVFSWAAPDWPAQTEVSVTFEQSADGTQVALAHRFFDRLDPGGSELRAGFAGGWVTVLQQLAEVAQRDATASDDC
jgi:uncharacterized protein YndB with AHSA1/START domain